MRKRYGRVTALGALVLALASILSGCPDPNIAMFADAGLEAAVRHELGKPFGLLTRTELLGVTELDAASRNIHSLAGIQNMPNLMWLDLANNNVANLGSLANLANLAYLNLDTNRVTDIGPLAGLFSLNTVILGNNYSSSREGNLVWELGPLVTNAANGGIGPGSLVVLERRTLVDVDTDELVPSVAAQIAQLVQFGVDVALLVE